VKHRPLLLAAAVAVLAALNVWHWSAGKSSPRERTASGGSAFGPADFRLKVGVASIAAGVAARDIFQPKLPPPPPPPAPLKQVEVKVEPPPAPVKTAQELAEEAARAEIGQIKLVGVAFRGGQAQAYLVKGEQAYLVQTGAKVGDRFRVEAISADGIQLLDPSTQVGGRIPVSGK
jgi:hypothetical protein